MRHLPRRELARLAAYIPQSSQPLFDYTVRDTVLMGADPFHAPGPSQQETADRVLETLGIRNLADRGINEISGGERQLTLIARALAQQARILLMDEPAANLDYGNQFRLLQQVRRLTEQGYTVLLSTHNPEHAFRFATDVLVLREGGVLFAPAKAANAGGVAVSGLEMCQNSMRLAWTFDEVDQRLHQIMLDIFHNIYDASVEYGVPGNLLDGANIAGFRKVADAMLAQGVC